MSTYCVRNHSGGFNILFISRAKCPPTVLEITVEVSIYCLALGLSVHLLC